MKENVSNFCFLFWQIVRIKKITNAILKTLTKEYEHIVIPFYSRCEIVSIAI